MHQKADDSEALHDAAKFARCVRKRSGLTQPEFSRRIAVALDTIRNREQGKRCPTGAAKSTLKMRGGVPKSALPASAVARELECGLVAEPGRGF